MSLDMLTAVLANIAERSGAIDPKGFAEQQMDGYYTIYKLV